MKKRSYANFGVKFPIIYFYALSITPNPTAKSSWKKNRSKKIKKRKKK